MGYREEYGPLLDSIVQEGDVIAMRYFRGVEMRVDRKGDGSAVTQADRGVEEMARAKVAASGLALDVLGEEMGGRDMEAASSSDRARLIIDPIDGTEEFSRGIPTFGTLLGIEHRGEIVAGIVSAPALGTRWFAYRGEGAFRDVKKIHVSGVSKLSDAMIFTTGTGPKKMQRTAQNYAGCTMRCETAAPWAGFGNTCWLPKARLTPPSIGPPCRGTWLRWV